MIPKQDSRSEARSPGARAVASIACGVATLAAATALALPAPLRFGLPGLLLIGAARAPMDGVRRRARRRALADAWLIDALAPSPVAFGWRVEELTGSGRRALAGTFRAFASEAVRPWRPGAPRLNRVALRAHADLLAELGEALGDCRRTVSPRAVLRAEALITDIGSPLNCAARNDELDPTLRSILAEFGERLPAVVDPFSRSMVG